MAMSKDHGSEQADIIADMLWGAFIKERTVIMNTFCEYVKLSVLSNTCKKLGIVKEDLEEKKNQVYQCCLNLIEKNDMYSGDDPEGFIIRYTKEAFDERTK